MLLPNKIIIIFWLPVFIVFTRLYAQPDFPLVPPLISPIENHHGYSCLQWTKDNPDERVIGYFVCKELTFSNGQVDSVEYFTTKTSFLDTTFEIRDSLSSDIARYWVVVMGTMDGEVVRSRSIGSRSISGQSDIHEKIVFAPGITDEYGLFDNYPNPFNSMTQIIYRLLEDSSIELVIYNILGEEIITVISRFETSGQKSVRWDGKDSEGNSVPSGMYIFRLFVSSYESEEDFHLTRKMLLLR